ncbi:MAG: DUF3795 domain-containing protein [Candidatus Fermentibacteraceae bacterium]|nr:DUF3795 domain-containing protein [Candidatus Fermentibacteraceae bacterium]MBN2609830.1 DUF3795 domain-containing protein [Candidatus Fermentibacteraceae bacterium]
MSKLGYCGLDCEGCPAFIAYRTDDQALRVKTAEEWSKEHEADIKPGDINCTGCISTGIQFPWCSDGCPIRQCALVMQVDSCGVCGDYPCEKLGFILDSCPDARQRLDDMMPR